MERLEDKIKQYQSAAITAAIGVGVSAIGFTVDYPIVRLGLIFGGH